MFDAAQEGPPAPSSGKTSRASFQAVTTPLGVSLAPWWVRNPNCSRQGKDGRTLVLCLDPSEQPHGGYWMPNISAWPNAAAVCSLSQVLEPSTPARFFLSSTACAGILRRAEKRGKTLPPALSEALTAGVTLTMPELATSSVRHSVEDEPAVS